MKHNDQLTHNEILSTLSTCLRDLMAVEITHRNIPNLINRGKAVAAIVTANHREEIMEMKREMSSKIVLGTVNRQVKNLKQA